MEPCCDAIISAEPRNAPTHGVQPMEKTIPNKKDDAWVCFFTSIELRFVLFKKLMLSAPVKFRPKMMTISPVIMLTIILCEVSSPPRVPAKAPRRIKTRVNPATNVMALGKALCLGRSVVSPAK